MSNGSVHPTDFMVTADSSLLLVIFFDTLVSLLCAFGMAFSVVWFIKQHAKSHNEREKLGRLIHSYLWEYEDSIMILGKILKKMEASVLHQEVTELHVLSYKYRCEKGVFDKSAADSDSIFQLKLLLAYSPRINILAIIKKLEKLFESLAVQLSCKGKCHENIRQTFGYTLYTLAQSTAILWSNKQAKVVGKLVKYFAGKHCEEKFNSSVMADEELEMLVMARAPYVNQLILHGEHFVLKDVEVSSEIKMDIRNKIRYLDTFLAKNDKIPKAKEQSLVDSYNSALEICLNYNFVQNRNKFTDLSAKIEENKCLIAECSTCLLHLLRIMSMPKYLQKIENDDKFFQFLMQLYETLYTWTNSKTMLEVIERSRNNIFTYLRGLTLEQVLLDKEFTKAKLEHLEKELYRHLSHLTLRQVHADNQNQSNSDDLVERRLRSINSESSIYTLAQSTCSYPMKKQVSTDQTNRSIDLDLVMLHQQRNLDQGSLLSSSSLYATAASLTSINENMPLMGTSPSKHEPFLERQQSPLSDRSDFCETAV